VIFIGLIEGLAEATALFIKVFSGAISDYLVNAKVWQCWDMGWGR
jgi:hypothetical protein